MPSSWWESAQRCASRRCASAVHGVGLRAVPRTEDVPCPRIRRHLSRWSWSQGERAPTVVRQHRWQGRRNRWSIGVCRPPWFHRHPAPELVNPGKHYPAQRHRVAGRRFQVTCRGARGRTRRAVSGRRGVSQQRYPLRDHSGYPDRRYRGRRRNSRPHRPGIAVAVLRGVQGW